MIRTLRRWSIAFLIPGLALYLYIVILPSLQVMNSSLYNWQAGQTAVFTGLNNFTQLVADQTFIAAAWHTLALLLGAMIIQVPLGFLFAVLIHRRLPGAAFFQTVFFIPMVLSSVVIAVLWTQVYQTRFGLLNVFLRSIGLGDWTNSWLGDPKTALWAIIVVIGWQFVGLYMLLFLAALQRIPTSIYEAGSLDGAQGFSQLWHLTIPMTFDTFKLAIVLVVTGSVQYFNLIWAMTLGGPANASSVLASYMYIRAFQESRLGYAAAVATVMLLLNLLLAVGLQRLFRRDPLELG